MKLADTASRNLAIIRSHEKYYEQNVLLRCSCAEQRKTRLLDTKLGFVLVFHVIISLLLYFLAEKPPLRR